MIDLHSHILPGMDDGSSCVEESEKMLRQAEYQGISVMAATPHFYADREDPGRFLERRAAALERVAQVQTTIEILPGAEVAWFAGMRHCEQLRQLRIGRSRLLLVEMPFCAWSDRMVDEVCALQLQLGLQPVLAHVERYGGKDRFPKYRDRLLREGILFQSNAECFMPLLSGGKAIDMLRRGSIHFLGSDCHNMTTRQPNLGDARQKITKKLGRAFLDDMDAFALSLLK